MYDLPDHTLQMYLSNPMFDRVNLEHVSMKRMMDEIGVFNGHHSGKQTPEADALSFYFLNHSFHLIQAQCGINENLGDDLGFVADLHRVQTSVIGKRLLFHTFLAAVATTPDISSSDNAKLRTHLIDGFGEAVSKAIQNRSFLTGSINSARNLGHLDTTIGRFSQAIVSTYAFSRGSYWARAYTPIAALVSECFRGECSLEQFTDQAFSLQHTGGSIFTKGLFYTTPEADMPKILDIQDAGQIPQLITLLKKGQGVPRFRDSQSDNPGWFGGHGGSGSAARHISKDLARAHQIMMTRFPTELGGAIDMKAVQESADRRKIQAVNHQKKIHQAMGNRGGGGRAAPANEATPGQQRAAAGVSTLLGGFKI